MSRPDSEVSRRTFAGRCCTGFGWAASCSAVLLFSIVILQVNDLIQLFWLGTLVNVALSVTKIILAQVTVQKALMADAIHGLGDTAAEVVTAFAYIEAARPPDKEHPWGHGKIESIGAVIVTCILLYISFSMGYDSITSLRPMLAAFQQGRSCNDSATGKETQKEVLTANREEERLDSSPCQHETGLNRQLRRAAIAVGVASMVLKEALYHATLDAGEQAQSKLAVATAWHHRSDSLAAGVALTSQLGSALGAWPGLDPLGSGVVAAMLGHSAINSLHDSLNDLLDYNSATDHEEGGVGDKHLACGSRSLLARTITGVQGVRNHTLRTRRMGPFCLVDVTIVVDARISASAASMIAELVHDHVIHDFRPTVTDVLVHVDPDGSPQSHRLETHSEANTIAEQVETLDMLNPEDIEAQTRAALLQDAGDPDLPQIIEVTELHIYYHMEDPGPENDWKVSACVDVKVDFRLKGDTTIRKAAAAGRAARERVRAALPGIVRDVDANLQLDIDSSEDRAPTLSPEAPKALCLSKSSATHDTHGSWGIEREHCAPAAKLATSAQGARLADQDRHLRQVKLIWERGPEARKVRAPYLHTAGHGEKITWKQMPRWHPLLVHWARRQHDTNSSVRDAEGWAKLA
ncbi:unnamed protein product [Durusdinium trenchii]|uniref:Cation efflux protein cytoplasmic domain-containing protein n=1 Tax=Durusdinium trenchii TaxID=1381693 RepID=A0ABP0T073_9DINO